MYVGLMLLTGGIGIALGLRLDAGAAGADGARPALRRGAARGALPRSESSARTTGATRRGCRAGGLLLRTGADGPSAPHQRAARDASGRRPPGGRRPRKSRRAWRMSARRKCRGSWPRRWLHRRRGRFRRTCASASTRAGSWPISFRLAGDIGLAAGFLAEPEPAGSRSRARIPRTSLRGADHGDAVGEIEILRAGRAAARGSRRGSWPRAAPGRATCRRAFAACAPGRLSISIMMARTENGRQRKATSDNSSTRSIRITER